MDNQNLTLLFTTSEGTLKEAISAINLYIKKENADKKVILSVLEQICKSFDLLGEEKIEDDQIKFTIRYLQAFIKGIEVEK